MRARWHSARYWVLEVGRIEISCWGRPRVRVWRPAWSRRYESPPVNKISE